MKLIPANDSLWMFHYTNTDGYNGIRSAPIWRFRASQPPDRRPFGTYFTDLDPATPTLANRLRIPRTKVRWLFAFVDAKDLKVC
jgi:hypothetical protein